MAGKTYTFNPETDIPSLKDKVILITGANSGLGKLSAIELAKHSPARIFMTARSRDGSANAVAEAEAAASPGTSISPLILDLGSFASVRSAARELTTASGGRLDVLLLNAGVMGVPAGTTQEGYEIQMGTNHVGHALLLKLLTPTLRTTAESTGSRPRVVSLSSVGYKHLDPPVIHLDALKTPEGGQPCVHRYTQSKLANLLYAREFAGRNPWLTMVSVHPGEAATALFTREPGDDFMRHLQKDVVPAVAGPVEEAVKNQLWAATAAEDGIESGVYYEPVGVKADLEGGGGDEALALSLWEWTERELRDEHL